MSELRTCIVTTEGQKYKALFHAWSSRAMVAKEPAFNGGYSTGQVSYPVGIVELEDGSVKEYHPSQIRFTDGKIKEYAFRQIGDGK